MFLVKDIKYLEIFMIVIVATWLTMGDIVRVYSISQEQRNLFDSGIYYYDLDTTGSGVCGPISPAQSSGTGGVFYIGDSLTVGMVGSGGLLEKTKQAGYTVDTNLTTNNAEQKSGPSVEATQGYRVANTIESLATSTGRFTPDKVSIIVVMLGTNSEANQAQATQDMITYLKSFNQTAKILWVNTYAQKNLDFVSINSGISQGVGTTTSGGGISIVDFASAAASSDFGFANDGIHHTNAGYGLKADFVVQNLSESDNGSAVGQSCGGVLLPETGDRDVDLIMSLKNSGMSIQQAIGILANVYRESGNNPKRHECVYSLNSGVSKGIPENIMDPDGGVSSSNQLSVAEILLAGGRCNKNTVAGYGWGLVQWTPASKIIVVSSDKNVPYHIIDSLQYQADFLISQLKGQNIGLVGSYVVDAGTAEASRNRDFFNTSTPEDAAEFFAINYERCAACKAGNPEITERRNEATNLFIKYGSL